MDKIILTNHQELEFITFIETNITIENKTIEELELLFTKENLVKVKVSTLNGEVYRTYNNLECTSITKNLKDNICTVNLKQLDPLVVKIEQLQATVDTLVLSGLEE